MSAMNPECPHCAAAWETLSKLAVKPQVSALVSVRDNAVINYLAHLDGFNIEWLAHDEQAVDARLAQMQIPADDYFIWITGEGKSWQI
ncbi:SIP domain-containing protein [Escherichia coli]